jgi:hypothetical protein
LTSLTSSKSHNGLIHPIAINVTLMNK